MPKVSSTVTRSKAVRWIAILFGATFTAHGAPGNGETAAPGPQPEQVQTVHLEYQEAGYSVVNCSIPIVIRSTPFPKEPALGRDKVIRGNLQLGSGASNPIAFVWNRTAGKLYLDLNRNLDLTDDPAGVFASQAGSSPSDYQVFDDVRLPFQTPSGNRRVLVDLSFLSYMSQSNCSAAVRSFWQGKLTLQNKDWQVGIIENDFNSSVSPEGCHLLFRPWEAGNKPFNTSAGSLDTFPFARKLFIHDHAYQMDCTPEASGDNPRLALQFSEQHPALGELNITGSFIQRLILEGGTYLVVIDNPGAKVRVPMGGYSQPKVWLKKGAAEAFHDPRPQPSRGMIVIEEKRPAVLVAGGPLTNSVVVTQRGATLNLRHQLLGAGGQVYTRPHRDRSHPPTFAVYRSGKKIGSGKFEFG
ncbi:MAG: hypothetical protein HY360_02915 [Verrucomicrobia bacterium]|nr:hypothetical protein [Verrucomicrobiota bacterium]